ncbi:hypothetical protein N0V93_006729 [Gnomoniopsis smithogilvyi]|uniref:Uncharacterized protein n=1 Tax=Gnomoniopsis smithogilvyi TaxID=1191159 RepID=A0A9W8YPX5_9PEZI|nr:hypothetical protein N0V93_006729 [Gnomoniopsis smithogilvyi]
MEKASSARTWASIAGKSASSVQKHHHTTYSNLPQRPPHLTSVENHHHRQDHEQKHVHAPQHQPRSSTPNEAIYVLTLLTDKPHHSRLTSLRKRYFPPHLNKLSAHLTLFHALPGSRLQSTVIPDLQRLAQCTAPFQIRATGPFRMKRGVGIGLARNEAGYDKARDVHKVLQTGWKGERWLSEQDAQEGWRGHYTIMNKVDDEHEVARAFNEVKQDWQDDLGVVEGLGLVEVGEEV